MTSILMPWPHKMLNPNTVVSHWRVRVRLKKYQKLSWFYFANTFPEIRGANKFRMTFNPPDKRRRDLDNIIASLKSGLDGLALAAKVDDSQFRIEWPTELSEPIKGGQILVEILP